MPLKLSRLFEEVQTVEMPYLGEVLSLTWTPAGWTPAAQDHFVSADGENASTLAMVDVLASLLVRWDLLDDDGEPIPTTKDRLESLPKGFLLDVLRFLGSSNSPNPASEESSPGT